MPSGKSLDTSTNSLSTSADTSMSSNGSSASGLTPNPSTLNPASFNPSSSNPSSSNPPSSNSSSASLFNDFSNSTDTLNSAALGSQETLKSYNSGTHEVPKTGTGAFNGKPRANGSLGTLEVPPRGTRRPVSSVDIIPEESGSEESTGTRTRSPFSHFSPLLRKRGKLNGRLSASAQMLNGDTTHSSGANISNGMGGGKAVRPNRLSTAGFGSLDEFRPSPNVSLLNSCENSTISEIPSKEELAKWRYRNSVTTLSANNTPHQHTAPLQNGFEDTPNDHESAHNKGIHNGSLISPIKPQKGRFVKIFPEISEVDAVIKWYHCAYWNDMLFQGILFVTSNWFCFHSKLMGKRRIVIPIGKVMSISKKKTALIIPNAIGVTTDSQKFVFGSLISRDSTYELMTEVWKQSQQTHSEVDGGVDKLSTDRSRTSTQAYSSDEGTTASSSESCSNTRSHSLTSPSLEVSPLSSPGGDSVGLGESEDSDHRVIRNGHTKSGAGLSRSISHKPQATGWLKRLLRTNILLFVSATLVLFLLVSAVLLAYRLILLQSMINSAPHWSTNHDLKISHSQSSSSSSSSSSSASSSSSSSERLEMLKQKLPSSREHLDESTHRTEEGREELLYSSDEQRVSAIERINTVLQSHIQVIDQINEAMKDLSHYTSKPCGSSSTNQEPALKSEPVTLSDSSQ